MAILLPLTEPRRGPDAEATGFALWRLGFRPFYLFASAFGAVSVACWALQASGLSAHAYLRGPLWHAHEMLFGFVFAVVVGFLFTAGRNWTGQPTPTGRALMAMVALWAAGRILVLTPFAVTAAAVNVAFALVAAGALARPLVASGNRRNYFFVAVLAAMALAVLAVHLDQLGVAPGIGWPGIRLGLDLVLFIVSVMTGRILAMFTNNGVPGAGARRVDWLEKLASGSVLALAMADVLALPAPAVAAIAACAAVVHGARFALLRSWRVLREPVVWVLHGATAWIPVHLALRALSALGAIPASAATHALTVGVLGGLVIGMITRTARGHTGRPLRGGWTETAMYALVLAAAPVRVFLPLVSPGLAIVAIEASAGLWVAGFALYAIRYATILARPRVDGREG
ncbi:MAG TPA: NnrS family protein [Burkholderiaceae bacterium]